MRQEQINDAFTEWLKRKQRPELKELKDKSAWGLLLDIPALLIMWPCAFVGVLFVVVMVGFEFGRHHADKWYMRQYRR